MAYNDVFSPYEDNLKKRTPSQIAGEQAKVSYQDVFTPYESRIVRPQTPAPPAQPITPPAPQNNWFQQAANILKSAGDAITSLAQRAIPQLNPSSSMPSPLVKTPTLMATPSNIPQTTPVSPAIAGLEPTLGQGPTQSVSAQLTPNVIQVMAKNPPPIDSKPLSEKVGEWLAAPEHRAVYNANEQFLKTVNDVYKANPELLGFQKGAAGTYLGFTKQYQEFDQKMYPAPSGEGLPGMVAKTRYTAGEIAGTVAAFIAGGEVLGAVGLGRAALPILFGITGQTSTGPEATVAQRIAKAPVDILTGFLFGGIGVSPKLMSVGTLKGAALSAGVVAPTSFISYLIAGMKPEDAAKYAAKAALIQALFYTSTVAAKQVLSTENLNKEVTMTPEQIRTQAEGTNIAGTQGGKDLLDVATKAEAQGKDVKLTVVGVRPAPISKVIGKPATEALTGQPQEIKISNNQVTTTNEQGAQVVMQIEYVPKQNIALLNEQGAPTGTPPTTGKEVAVIPPKAPEVTPPVAVPVGTALEAAQTFNIKNAAEIKTAVLNGQKESARLDNPQQITIAQKYPANNLPADAGPNTLVTVYRAGTTPETQAGDFVTLDKANAEKYVVNRPGSKVMTAQVPLADLVFSGGIKSEFIFAPKENIPTAPATTQTVKSVTSSQGLEKLAEEAKKYKSAAEFESAVLGGKISQEKMKELGFTFVNSGRIESPQGVDLQTFYNEVVKPVPQKIRGIQQGIDENIIPSELQGMAQANPVMFRNIWNSNTPEEFYKKMGSTNGEEIKSLKKYYDEVKAVQLGQKPAEQLVTPVQTQISNLPQEAIKPEKTVRLFTALNKKTPLAPLNEAVIVRNGKMEFTNLNLWVSVPTDKADGVYRIVGTDFNPATDLKSEDFPEAPKLPEKKVFEVLGENLITAIKNVSLASSTEDTRPVLMGAKFTIQNNQLEVVTTDAFRLSVQTVGVKTFDSKLDVNVSQVRDLAKVVDLLDGAKVEINSNADSTSFVANGRTIINRNVEGNYPAFEKIFPLLKFEYVLDKKALQNAIKEITPYAKESANMAGFIFDGNKLTIRADAAGVGEKSVEIPVTEKPISMQGVMNGTIIMPVRTQEGGVLQGKNGVVFNYRYVDDMLKTLSGNEVYIRLPEVNGKIDPLLPAHFSDKPEPIIRKESVAIVKEVPKPVKPKARGGNELGFNPKNLIEPSSPAAQAEADKIIKQSEIAKVLSEKLGVPIRRGKFRAAGAIGIYKTAQKVVRIKSGGIATVFHEVAHYLDDTIGFSKDLNLKERKALMAEYGFSYEGQAEKQRKEGFAEFIRFRMTGQTEKANAMAPEFSKIFDAKIATMPQIKEVLDQATLDYARWVKQPAAAKILSQLSIGSQNKGPFKDRAVSTVHDLYTAALDDLHPLAEFVGIGKRLFGKIPAEQDPYLLARNLRGWAGKAELYLNKGTFGKTFWKINDKGQTVMDYKGKGYSEIMKPLNTPQKLDDFRVFIVAQRIVNDLAPRKIRTGISLADAKTALAEIGAKNPEFEKIAAERRAFKDQLLEYAKENSLIGPEGLAKLKELNKFHAPFYRVMEETGTKFLGKSKFGGNISSPIKKIKGSEREIIDPLESDVKDVYAIINAAERNNIGIAMANLAKRNYELGRLFEQVSKPMKPVRVNAKEVFDKVFKETGADMEVPEDLAQLVVTLFRPTQATGPNMLNVNFGDKQVAYELDPNLFKAIQGLNLEDMGILMKILGFPAKLLRSGATLTPDFSVRNPLRDQFTAFVYSKYGFIPGVDLVRGMWEVFKNARGKSDVYDLWRAGGGEHSMFVSLDREVLQETFKDLLASRGRKVANLATHPLRFLQIVSEIGEEGTRLGEMRRGLEMAKNPIEVAHESREVTLDFARIGAKSRAMNLITAFFNANIQGTDKMIRAFHDNPFRTLWKVLLGITLPSILLYLANRKDKRWKEIPMWQKNLFWIVMTPNHVWRIPKPFELGILFGSVPERTLEAIDSKDPKAIDELFASIAGGFSPGFIPTALIPIIENITNYSFFLDRPIVGQGKSSLPPAQQAGNYTSETAKLIGETLNYSPAKIDNLIQGYTGGLGRYGISAMDKILTGTGIATPPPAPASTIEDTPIIKAFTVRNPIGSSSESVNRIYDMYGTTTAELTYVRKLAGAGQKAEAIKYIKAHPEVVNAPALGTLVTLYSTINKASSEVLQSRDMTPAQKRAKIDQLDTLQTTLARQLLDKINKGE